MIPFVDINKEFELFKNEIASRIQKVLYSSQFILGEEVGLFEGNIARLLDVRYAIGVASGTDALILALKALNIGQGDKVITTPFSFFATTEAILHVGATPVYVDIKPDTLNIDENKIEEKIDENTKAILIVHLYGNPCNMDKICEIAKKYKLNLIEDAAQSFGSKYKNQFLGTFGDIGCFSFYPSKNLGAYGDAGMVVTNSSLIFEKMLLLRNHGLNADGEHILIGFNSRLDSIQAAILNVKIEYINQFIEKRRKIASLYNTSFEKIKEIDILVEERDGFHSYNVATFKFKDRDNLKNFLEKNGISCSIYYKKPIPAQPSLEFLKVPKQDYYNALNASKEVLSLPLYPFLSENSVKEIISKIKEFYGRT